MTWDKTRPLDSEKIRLGSAFLRAQWEALEDAFNREHIFPGTYGGDAGTHRAAPVIPAGTKAIFFQAAAPTGWTQDTTIDDRVIRITHGAGGGGGGGWEITGLNTTPISLGEAQIPAHSHGVYTRGSGSSGYAVDANAVYGPSDIWVTTSQTGSTEAHNHPVVSTGGWRPAYLDCIICTKD